MTFAFKPLAGRNAIEACNLTVRLPNPIDATTFDAIAARAAELAVENELPARQQQVAPAFLAGFGLQSGVQGAAYQRYAADGTIEVELKCELQGIGLTVRRYEEWADFYRLVEAMLLPLLPLYLSTVPAVSAVLLQYDDIFLSTGERDRPVAGEVFRPDTRWVTLYDPTTDQPWHSHFGVYLPVAQAHRRLVNVNVNVNDEVRPPATAPHRAVGISILTGEMFDIPGEYPLLVEPGLEAEKVGDLIQGLHDFQKTVLQEILSAPYLELIGC